MPFTLKSNVAQVIADVHANLGLAVKDVGDGIVDDIRQRMDEPKSGRQYKGLPHRSSAPGESPATQSGDVAASYQFEPTGDTSGVVGSDSPIARELENGRVNMAPRPVFGQAVERARKTAQEKYGDAVRIGIQKNALR